ncbi:MAG: MBL fold metallo-hydrolase [Acidobacteriaceae bacterium]
MKDTLQFSRRSLLRQAGLLAGAAALRPFMGQDLASAQTSSAPNGGVIANFEASGAKTPVKTVPLTQNIFMLHGVGGNIAVLTGPDGKLMVDASVAAAAPHVKQALDAISSQPLRLLINTHWHFDHTDGNAAMHGYGATILAHVNTRKRLMTPQVMEVLDAHFPAAPPAAWPVETFTDALTLYQNGQTVHLAHLAPAHTDSDIFVHFSNANVLHTGDIWFNGFYPLIDDSTGGNIDGMIAAVHRLLPLADNATRIIPGHGPLGNKAALTGYREMLETVRDRVARLKRSGKTLQETVAARPTADLDAKWGTGGMSPDTFVGLVYKTVAA